MNKQTLAACIFAAITLGVSSCFLFEKSKPQVSEKTIIGNWKIDSVETTNFSTAEDDTVKGLFFTEPPYKDSTKINVVFAADSTYNVYKNDTIIAGRYKYYFDSGTQKLFLKADTTYMACAVSALNDSAIRVDFDAEGVHYNMKKQP